MGRFVMLIAAALLAACSSASPGPAPAAPGPLVGSCPVSGTYVSIDYVTQSGTCGPRTQRRTFGVTALDAKVIVNMDVGYSNSPSFESTDFDPASCTLTGSWSAPTPLGCAPDGLIHGTTVLQFTANGITGSEAVQDLECTTQPDGGLFGECSGAYAITGTRQAN